MVELDWEEYQEVVGEVFIGWEEKVRELDQELGGEIVEVLLSRWKEIGIGGSLQGGQGWWEVDVVRLIAIRKVT